MFTGLVEQTGRLLAVRQMDAGRELRIQCEFEDLALGDSVAVNGVCLTVREKEADWFVVAAIGPTLDRTNIAAWRIGDRVNLERALRVDDRLGGHFVQGHVDGVATVTSVVEDRDARVITLSVPGEVADLCVPHGSITVDGVSLTVHELPAPGLVQLSLIEYTLRHTNLGDREVGDRVHVEGDMIAKHVRQLLVPYRSAGDA